MIKIKKIYKKYQDHIHNGFTLAELIIVIAIIAIISTLTLFNNAKLNSSVLLSNTAYEISLIIRDAQVSGIGSKVRLDGGVATTSNQGVYIDISNNAEQIIFFADKNSDNQYDIGEENQIYNIENKRAGKILSICTLTGAQNETCSTSNISELNILFKRPNPEAYFYYKNGANLEPHLTGYAVINIGFDGGECKSIVVYKTGAIQIDKSFCNNTP